MLRACRHALLAFAVVISACQGCREAPADYLSPTVDLQQHLDRIGLGPGDVFEVSVYGEERLSGIHRIAPDGAIQFPLINRVVVEGMTPSEIAEELKKRLQDGYLRDPSVSVFVKEYNSKKVFVLGEVERPGTFPYSAQMNIVEAITLAGGFKDSGNANYVIVTRHSAEGDTRVPVPVKKITEGKAPNFSLLPGDIIFVPDTLL
jgi:protein involved in polysaccharide export with SLBB domain